MPSRAAATALAITLFIAACGSGKHGADTGSLSEAKSAATGDIPDNQVFLTFRNRPAGYSIKYPEGWARSGGGANVTFQDKDNLVHVVVTRGPRPTPASVRSSVAQRATGGAPLRTGTPRVVSIRGAGVVKVTYATLGAPNPVTGKRAELVVDRYVFARGGRVATVDLGTPKGVDNVDAYRMMSRSFTWQ